ncbi:DUF1127 domain-containing protein [Roseobacter sp.]|uniref:DUF1127 domain-containing protein n=1 Tax=Roseobacter sp. TaxID=1907202 RepID=UPI00385E1466
MALIDHFQQTQHCAAQKPRRGLKALVTLWRTRRALAQLDDRALEDIGVTRHAADLEAKRSIWDVPQSWKFH